MAIFFPLIIIAYQLQLSQHNVRTVHHAQTDFPCDLRQSVMPQHGLSAQDDGSMRRGVPEFLSSWPGEERPLWAPTLAPGPRR